jgi:hypothetical protein
MLNQSLQKQFALGKTRTHIEYLLGWLTRSTDQDINEFVQMAHQENCVKSEGTSLLEARQKIKSEFEDYHAVIHDSFNFFFRINTGFTCSLCEQDNSRFFKFQDSGKGMVIQADKQICSKVYVEGFNEGHLKVFHLLHYLEVFTDMIGCLAKEEVPLSPTFNSLNYNQLQEKGFFCSNGNNWIEEKECVDLCHSLPVINGNAFSHIMVSVDKARILANEIIKDFKLQSDTVIQSDGNIITTKIDLDNKKNHQTSISDMDLKSSLPQNFLKFDSFIEPNGGESQNKGFITLDLRNGEGLDIQKFQMYLVKSQPLVGFAGLFLLVALFAFVK